MHKILILTIIITVLSSSVTATSLSYFNNFNKRGDEKKCPHAFLTATSQKEVKGQIVLYQGSDGNTWFSGDYQWGFQPYSSDSCSCGWTYTWTIENGCGDVIYNLTDSLYTSDILTCKSDCHGYIDDTPKMSYKKRRNPLERGNPEPKDTCKSVGFGGECGTKPTIFKCNGLSWDCGKEGFKYQTCSGKDKYKDKAKYGIDGSDDDDDHKKSKSKPNTFLMDQGPETGIYMIINSCCLSKKRQQGGTSAATINVNDQGGEIAPAAPAAAAPAAPAAAPAAPAAAPAAPAAAPAAPAPAGTTATDTTTSSTPTTTAPAAPAATT